MDHFCGGKFLIVFCVEYVMEVAASGATAGAVSFSGCSCLTLPAPFLPKHNGGIGGVCFCHCCFPEN